MYHCGDTVNTHARTHARACRLTVARRGEHAEHIAARAVVLAVGVAAMQGIADASVLLSDCPTFAGTYCIGGISVQLFVFASWWDQLQA
jgi:hypothetical protein